ncbi:GNAT family acetyltransferase [Tenacibaculum holothuriorum]|uniref:GNAT family acetyltransferase n=1 Tax=Tenacibaculum holothuriorum TaxID=1635173 RepID=A0A1Y2PGW6_9FLAO|nr:GNAT family N-acetyltransferase [Tenacibaculum holothuriorum]OSY89410.1 GNAT family acetyltransferase [Tenacibaculum holothuriorum]
MKNYIFTSERLGFRNWKNSDIDFLFELNSNKEVMKYFPSTQTKEQCEAFMNRMQNLYYKTKFCYFLVEELTTQKSIGFIGLSEQTYKADFNPSIDIGWRLHPDFWNKGYATEGAKASLLYGFQQLKLKEIVSVAPIINAPSISVMNKIGMEKVNEFNHPLLAEFPNLEKCVLYRKSNTM